MAGDEVEIEREKKVKKEEWNKIELLWPVTSVLLPQGKYRYVRCPSAAAGI
jgi:hypothetical protein